MIALILLFSLGAGALFSLLAGIFLFSTLRNAISSGNATMVLAVSLVVAGAVIALAVVIAPLRSHGAMSGDEFMRLVKAAAILGAAPGLGMSVTRLVQSLLIRAGTRS